ncbi:MAG: nitroreductase family protein [Aristaeellaceae bacterium]
MIRKREKGILLVLIALMSCLSLGALAEEVLLTIQAMHRASAFSSEDVVREDLEVILKSGVSTAVQLENQPWTLVAITDAELLAQIGEESQQDMDMLKSGTEQASGGDAMQETLTEISGEPGIADAPAAIVIYADGAAANADFDCGAACQNMIHAANSLGYSTAVVTEPLGALNGKRHDEYCAQFDVDEDKTAVAVLLIGHADAEDAPEAFDADAAMAEKVRYME